MKLLNETTTIINNELTNETTTIINNVLTNETTTSMHPMGNTRHPVHLGVIVFVCSLMCGLTIFGNLVVIISVCLVRKLQTASNILIVSLAVSDILVGLLVMPLAMVPEMSGGKWTLGSIMCDIWTSTDVLLSTSSILNFLVISIDRYFIIKHPFKYAPIRKVKLLLLMIAGVWILSALVSLPPILGWGRPSENLPICQVNPKLEYQIFATMLSFFIPLVVVLLIYVNIYRTARTAVDTQLSVQMSQFLANNNNDNNNLPRNTERTLAQQRSNGKSYSSPQIHLNVSNPNTLDDNCSISSGKCSRRSQNSSNNSKISSFLSPTRYLGRRLSTPFNGRLSMLVSRRYAMFRHVQLPNQKAIRTLGVILGTFIACWLPFMLFALIKPLYETITELQGSKRQLNAPIWVDSVLLWIGYTSSMLNPLIYSKFNREFRAPFREVICCRCKDLNERIRRQDYLENLYGDNYLKTSIPTGSSANPKVTL